MDNAVNVGMSLEDLVKGRFIGNIELHELGSLAGDELDPIYHLIGGVVEIVGDDDLVTGV